MLDRNSIEEIIEDLQKRLPNDIPKALAGDNFERGKVSALYELITDYENLLQHLDNKSEEEFNITEEF